MKQTVPFSYKLYHRSLNLYYYGIKFAKGCQPSDLWSTYFSTSKIVKRLIREHGADSFDHEVRRTFSNAQEALLWEHKVLRRLNAAERTDWINQHNGGKKFRSPMEHSQKTKDLISKRGKGRTFTDEHKQKIRIAILKSWAGRDPLERKMPKENVERRAALKRGVPRPPEMIAKMRASKTGTKRHYLPDGSYVMLKP